MFLVTSLSHYMRSRFNESSPNGAWKPIVIGRHATHDEAVRHIERIRKSNAGVHRTDCTYGIEKQKPHRR